MTANQQPLPPSRWRLTVREVFTAILLISLASAIRFVNIGAAPPGWLSWSAGLFTDEAMYATDAAQMAMHGNWAPGNFHGAIITPPLYALQLAAFRLFGVSMEVARLVSAVFGLGTIVLLWIGLNAASNRRAAWIGAVLLAFTAPFVFYNRMALMETPTACMLTGAFACVCIAAGVDDKRRAGFWLTAAGAAFASAVAFKALAWLAFPGFVIGTLRISKRSGATFAAACLAAYAAYWVVVLMPYAGTLARMNRYYLYHQYLPHSLLGLGYNVKRAFVGYRIDGLFPTLALQCPILLVASVAAIVSLKKANSPPAILLAGWLLVSAAAWTVMSYSPSRYYVIAMPALAGLAAIALSTTDRRRMIAAVGLALILDAAVIVSALDALRLPAHEARSPILRGGVLAGQFAPRIAFGSDIVPVYVQPGLANDQAPVERFGVTHIVVTRSPDGLKWWRIHYPALINEKHFVGFSGIDGKYTLDFYRTDIPGQERQPSDGAGTRARLKP